MCFSRFIVLGLFFCVVYVCSFLLFECVMFSCKISLQASIAHVRQIDGFTPPLKISLQVMISVLGSSSKHQIDVGNDILEGVRNVSIFYS